MEDREFNVDASLKNIGEVLYKCLKYEPCVPSEIESALNDIEIIANNPEYLRQCEFHFKASGNSYILFYFSNIIYNLKTKSDLVLSQDVLKWLASVWKNFIQRNKTYQAYMQLHDKFVPVFLKYFSEDSSFINRLNNINLVSEQYGGHSPESEAELDKLEKFFQVCEEIIGVMKPTFYFLFDFFREMKAFTGESPKEAEFIEKRGLAGFGSGIYTYKAIVIDACKACAILEAAYLLLKKKKTSRQFRIFDGKKKFLTTSEIYEIYVDKFNFYKKELGELK